MTPKELKKLADACRKAGISSYSDGQVSFTVDLHISPMKVGKITRGRPLPSDPSEIEAKDTWESLSDEQKMFYSVNPSELEAQSDQ